MRASLGRVLRAEAGQLYELSDGKAAWLARIERAGRDEVTFELVEPDSQRAPAFEATLLLSIVNRFRFEWALEKADRIGCHSIVPLAARGVKRRPQGRKSSRSVEENLWKLRSSRAAYLFPY